MGQKVAVIKVAGIFQKLHSLFTLGSQCKLCLLVELEADEERMQQGIAYLEECGVTVSPVSSKVSYDESLCIDCGNCVSACFSHALTIGEPDWKLHFNPEKCIACKLCLKSCPLKLFRIEFAE